MKLNLIKVRKWIANGNVVTSKCFKDKTKYNRKNKSWRNE